MFLLLQLCCLFVCVIGDPFHPFKSKPWKTDTDPKPIKTDYRVIGEEIDRESAPSQVFVVLKANKTRLSKEYVDDQNTIVLCSGSILTSTSVITAANCIARFYKHPVNLKIQIGDAQNPSDMEEISVKTITVHDEYLSNGNDEYDLALLELDQKMTKGQKIKLPSPNAPINITNEAYIVGRVATGEKDKYTFRKATVTIVDQEMCKKFFESFGGNITERMLCAEYFKQVGIDGCRGHYGSSLIVNDMLYGIKSWGRSCGLTTLPGIYTRVSYFVNWIKSNIKI